MGGESLPFPRIDLHKKTFLFPFLCLQFFELLLDLFTFLRMGQQIIGRQGSGPCGNRPWPTPENLLSEDHIHHSPLF